MQKTYNPSQLDYDYFQINFLLSWNKLYSHFTVKSFTQVKYVFM